MGYGHADRINDQGGKGGGQVGQPGGPVQRVAPVDPALWDEPEMRSVLSGRDITALYQALVNAGVSQHRIARLTGQSQSEVSEIIKGRRVVAYDVHKRIADGLGIPPGRMGLAYDAGYEPDMDSSWQTAGEGDSPSKETPEEMKRRILIGATSLAALGQVVQGLGELAELALPTAEPLPSQLSMAHVHTVEAVTERLRDLARQSGGQGGLFGVAARYYSRWMSVPATEVIKARLGAALAELHSEAGYCSYDSGMDGTGHFTRALVLADQARDAVGIANAAYHAGVTLVRGHPNDALKEFQLGQLVLGGFTPGKTKPTLRTDDPRLPTLAARFNVNSAKAYALMGLPDQAKRHLAAVHEGSKPQDVYHHGELDHVTASVYRDLGSFDIAQQFATNAVRVYGDGYGRGRTKAELLLAEVYVRAGEPRGLVLAQQAIEAVRTLQSVAVRQVWLVPLTAALEARPGSEAKELARTARQVAATRG